MNHLSNNPFIELRQRINEIKKKNINLCKKFKKCEPKKYSIQNLEMIEKSKVLDETEVSMVENCYRKALKLAEYHLRRKKAKKQQKLNMVHKTKEKGSNNHTAISSYDSNSFKIRNESKKMRRNKLKLQSSSSVQDSCFLKPATRKSKHSLLAANCGNQTNTENTFPIIQKIKNNPSPSDVPKTHYVCKRELSCLNSRVKKSKNTQKHDLSYVKKFDQNMNKMLDEDIVYLKNVNSNKIMSYNRYIDGSTFCKNSTDKTSANSQKNSQCPTITLNDTAEKKHFTNNPLNILKEPFRAIVQKLDFKQKSTKTTIQEIDLAEEFVEKGIPELDLTEEFDEVVIPQLDLTEVSDEAVIPELDLTEEFDKAAVPDIDLTEELEETGISELDLIETSNGSVIPEVDLTEESDEALMLQNDLTEEPVEIIVPELDLSEEPVDFPIPKLHIKESVAILSKELESKLKSEGVVIKYGVWSNKEKDLLRRNFQNFQSQFGVYDSHLLLGIGRMLPTNKSEYIRVLKFLKAKHFYVRLGKDINERTLRTIYYKARSIFNLLRKSKDCTANDVTNIIKLQKTYGNNWTLIGQKLGICCTDCHGIYLYNKKPIKKGPWSETEVKQLILAMKSVTKLSNFHAEHLKGISWKKVSELVPTRNHKQCYVEWSNNQSKLFQNVLFQKWSVSDAEKLINILKNDYHVTEECDILWTEVHKSFKDVTHSEHALRRKWSSIKVHAPKEIKKNFPELIDFLYKKYINNIY